MQESIATATTIIPARPSDYRALTELWEASVRATHHFLKREDILFYKTLIFNEYLGAVNLFYKKDALNHITGFLGTSGDKIEMLFIDPAYRGNGIGRELLNYAVTCLGSEKVDVNEQNEQAVGFYLRFGFEVTGRSEVDSMGKPYPILNMELP